MSLTNEARVILISGGTEGIGKAAARALAGTGATVVLVARDRSKGERVLAELRTATDNPRLELLEGDLSKLDDVRRVAAEFSARHDRLDVLVNNAGALFSTHQLTVDGFEQTFALDHLAVFLLTDVLRPLLERTPGARVITTASDAHRAGKLNLDTVATRPDGKAGFSAYGDAKMANIVFTRELARRAPNLTAYAFHPGWVWTGFGLNNGGWMAAVLKTVGPWLARTPEQGADTLVWLATATTPPGPSGTYFTDRRAILPNRRAQDDALARALWELSARLVAV